MNQEKRSIQLLTVGALLFAVASAPCWAQTESPRGPDDTTHEIPSGTSAPMTPEALPVSEIVIPSLPDAITSSSDPNARRVVDMLDEAAALKISIFDPTALFEEPAAETSTKSSPVTRGVIAPRAGCVEYSPDKWVPDCEPVVRPGVVVCRFYRYNGSLCVEWFDARTPFTWKRSVRMDGTSGSSTFERFYVQHWSQNADLKFATYQHNQHIENPDLENGYADGPQDYWEFMVDGDGTLYTPSGKTDLATRVFRHKHHRYDFNDREFFIDSSSTLTCYPDGGFHVLHLCASLKTKELYTCYVAYWKDGEGGWMTFDEDGRLTDSGKIEGMPPA